MSPQPGPPLKPRPLGATVLQVTPLGLGLAALGRPGYINLGRAADIGASRGVTDLAARSAAVLDAAWSAGIRYFDAARSYGRAEEFLASWLSSRAIAAGEVVVGSKWGYTYTAGWRVDAPVHEVKEHSLAVLRRQWRESHDLLGPHLRLYQIHSATEESGVLDDPAVLGELARLREEHGVFIGLTLSGPRQAGTLRRALACVHEGQRVFDSVQATWNLLERSVAPALSEARDAGLGVIVKEALANGRLTPHNRDPEFRDRMGLLEQQAARLDATPDTVALAAALAQPWADVVLSGAAATEHLAANVQALGVPWDAEAEAALAALAEPAERYWHTRAELPWS